MSESTTFEIPFMGFYYSLISDDYDNQMEEEDICSGSVDWTATKTNTAEEWAKQASKESGIDFEFVELNSPRFYNYETDKIVVKVSNEEALKIKERTEFDEDFVEFVQEQCQSRDGFHSFMSTDITEWGEWDYREYTLAMKFLTEEDEESVYDSIRGNGGMSLILKEVGQ